MSLCLELLYDFYYSKNHTNCYKFLTYNLNNINLHTIKKAGVIDIFKYNIEYINHTNLKWNYDISIANNLSCTMSIGLYPNTIYSNLMNKKELYNITMLYILSIFVYNENIPHIILPVMYFDIDYLSLLAINNYIPSYLPQNINNKLYILVTEKYTDYITLNHFIQTNTLSLLQWKVIIFQIIYTLYKLQSKFTNFRHNRLNLHAIKIFFMNNPTQYKDKVSDGILFNIPNIKLVAKITDFEYSNTSDYIINQDAPSINENVYYDIHYILNCIYVKAKKHNNLPDKLAQFINQVIPKQLLFTGKLKHFTGLDEIQFSYTIANYNLLTPLNIIKKNIFFNEFIFIMPKIQSIDNSIANTKTSVYKGGSTNIISMRKVNFIQPFNNPTINSPTIRVPTINNLTNKHTHKHKHNTNTNTIDKLSQSNPIPLNDLPDSFLKSHNLQIPENAPIPDQLEQPFSLPNSLPNQLDQPFSLPNQVPNQIPYQLPNQLPNQMPGQMPYQLQSPKLSSLQTKNKSNSNNGMPSYLFDQPDISYPKPNNTSLQPQYGGNAKLIAINKDKNKCYKLKKKK